MSRFVSLQANDGNRFSVYQAEPNSALDHGAAIIVLQEIFGVNAHIRSVADTFAQHGYTALAPALFDRVQPEVTLEYNSEGREIGRGLAARLIVEKVLLDIEATIEYARRTVVSSRVGIVGYCLGGSYAWLSATRLRPDAAVGYYGSKVAAYAQEKPQVPVVLHFGETDKGIPVEDVLRVKQFHPNVDVYLYNAGHGFNRLGSESYNQTAAVLALDRTLEFFRKHLHPIPALSK